MVRDLRGVLEALRLHQHHLQLGGGVDVHHLVVAVLAAAILTAVVLAVVKQGTGGLLYRLLKIVLIIIILIIVGMNDLLQLVHQAHVQYLPRIIWNSLLRQKWRCPRGPCWLPREWHRQNRRSYP